MSEEQLLELKGSVEDVVYRNNQNGYSVLTMNCDGIAATAVGIMTDVNVGDELRLLGNWKIHPGYGEQFSFEYAEHRMPSTSASILKYLSSGAVKGVGRVTARRLVEAFGENTLEVMQNQPDRMTEVKGISKSKAEEICGEINKIFGMKEVMLYLEKYHISALESVRIWKKFRDDAVAVIEDNPYVLCEPSIAVSFERADGIAAALGRPGDDPSRIRAGIMYVITYNTGNGHTCLPFDKLISVASGYLRLDQDTVSSCAAEMISEGSLIIVEIDNRGFVFLPGLYRSESFAADRLEMMLKFPPESITGGEAALDSFEKSRNIEYAALQRRAILQALTGGLLILTGGPGTGKTTTLNAIIEIYKSCGLKVLLAAPTGRAAQRMTEVTGFEAKTIHRLLEVEWDNEDRPRFVKNERNLLDCDALILDEMSMVDISLFESALRALPLGCRLIMVGDSDQLPSVGPGNVLADLIASERIPSIRLTEIFRQSMQSLIVTNAHRIVRGEMPEITRTDSDFFFKAVSEKQKISEDIVNLCSTRLKKAYGYDIIRDIQVLCPGRKGELGVTELNKKLQQAVNPHIEGSEEIRLPVYTLRCGDKVMHTRNNYELYWRRDDGSEGSGVFNGDIGIVESIEKGGTGADIRYDDRVVSYSRDDLLNVELAYATTVHKSQGNEFNAVVMPMYYGAPQLYYRNLLYTAVTRAKKLLILVGNVSTLKKMVDNNKKTGRYSGLKDFLKRGEL